MKFYADKRRKSQTNNQNYRRGDLVSVINHKHNKFTGKWNKQPFIVLQDKGASVLLESPSQGKCLFNKSHLKPFYTNRNSASTRSSYDLDQFKGNSQNNEVMQDIPQVLVPKRSERICRLPDTMTLHGNLFNHLRRIIKCTN